MRNIFNKKGFTLVELLAVIVILALIMGIAVFSIGGVMDNAKVNTAKRSAGQVIEGVRVLLSQSGSLDQGTYFVQASMLEKGGESPLGGSFAFANVTAGNVSFAETSTPVTEVATGIYKSSVAKALSTCTATVPSFVNITLDSATGVYVYEICLTAGTGNKYLKGTESQMNSDDSSVVY